MEILNRPRQTLDVPEEVVPKADALTSFTTGIKRQNWASKAFSNALLGTEDKSYGVDLNYDSFEDEANEGYSPARMSLAQSEAEATAIRADLDQEYKELEIINSSGWGTAGEVFGGIFRPEALAAAFVPGGLAAVVTAETSAEVFNEAMLHQQQRTRTQTESYLNIGLVAGGTAILGGASKLFKYSDLPTGKQIVDDVKARDGIKEADQVNRSVGAAEAGGTLEEEGMSGGVLAEKLSIGQVARLLQSSSRAARVAIQKLADNPFFTKGGQKGQSHGPAVEAMSDASVGRAVATIQEVAKMQPASKLSVDEFEIEVGRALSAGDKHANPVVQKAAEKYRKELIDPILKDMQELGLLPRTKAEVQADIDAVIAKGETPDVKLLKELDESPTNLAKFAESYFPRVYRQDEILKNWDTLKSDLMRLFAKENPDIDVAFLEESALRTMNNMMGGVPLASGGRKGAPSSLNSRTLAMSDEMLEPYLDKRASSRLLKHAQGTAPYIQVKRTFGDTDLADVVRAVNEDYDVLVNKAKGERAKRKLNKQRRDDIDDIHHVRDRVLNQIERESLGTSAENVIRTLKAYNVSTQLGGITFSSLPDLVRPMMQYGFKSYAVGIKKAFQQVFDNSDIAKTQITRMGAGMERTLGQRALALTESEGVGASGSFNNVVNKYFPKITLFDQWTDVMETVTAHSAMDWTLRQAAKAKQGKRLTRSEMGRLSRMGFNRDDLIAIYDQAKGTAGMDDPILKFANTVEWNDNNLAKRFEAGIGGDVKRVIIRIGAGEKPKAMDNAFVSLMLQYQSFAISATNKMLIAGLQQRDLALATGLLANIALGSLVGAGKARLRGEDATDWDAEQWLYEGIDRSGILGVYRPGMSAIQAYRGYMPSRYLTRGIESTFGGPTVGQGGRVMRLGMQLGEGEYEDAAESALRLTPGVSNALHLRQVLQQLGEN